MEDFSQQDHNKIHYPMLASRAQGVKNPEVVNKKDASMSEETGKVLEKYTAVWFADGELEDIQDGKQETARAMLADSLPIAAIVHYTGLTQDEVLALQ